MLFCSAVVFRPRLLLMAASSTLTLAAAGETCTSLDVDVGSPVTSGMSLR